MHPMKIVIRLCEYQADLTSSESSLAEYVQGTFSDVVVQMMKILTTLFANSADDKRIIFFLIFSDIRLLYFMEIAS